MVYLNEREIICFLSKVNIKDGDVCWNWKASLMNSGYGQFLYTREGKTKNISAHRMAFQLFKGEIPSGMQVNHTCDNKRCVNPIHLYIGTQSENLYDAVNRGRHKSNNLFGNKNPKTKLNIEDVIKIRESYKSGTASQGALAKKYGVSQANISSIVLRETWKHI